MIPASEFLKKFEETAAACNRCGFCTSYCPTYKATGNESHSPRGRNQIFRALLEGKLSDPAQAVESVESCLLCSECTTVCFSEVPTADLMIQARDYLNHARGISPFLKFFLTGILTSPVRLRRLLKVLFLGKNLGAPWLLNKLGLLKRLAPSLAAADDLVERLPWRFLLETPEGRARSETLLRAQQQMQSVEQGKAGAATAVPWPRVAYMPVCGSQYLRPSIGSATLELLRRVKVDVVIPEVLCCGLPAASYGVLSQVRSMAKENIARVEKERYEAVIVDDTSCASHLKDYPKYFQEDIAMLPKAYAFAQKVKDWPTYFLQKGLAAQLEKTPWNGGPVAYHDPCKAQHALRLTYPPRELLGAIPRLKLVPVAEADQCCGGGGTYSFTHPEISRDVLDAKIENIIKSGCKIVVTSSASCLVQLAFGLRRKNLPIEALHLTEFLVQVLDTRQKCQAT